jgi:hypothetical protein
MSIRLLAYVGLGLLVYAPILAGGAAGRLQGGSHVQSAPHMPMSNLLLSMLNKLGIDQAQHGDSTGLLDV